MKKLLTAGCFLPLIAVFALTGCGTSPYTVFKNATGVAVPECGAVSTIDTTGWFGDGELVYTFHLDEENGTVFETRVQTAAHWHSLPMSATLEELVYEHFHRVIPRVESGYYFFYDEQNKRYSVPDNYFEQSYSYDFVIGLYDTETLTVYYYEQHT